MNATALILEDSRTQAEIISKMVQAEGWTPVICEDIRTASDSLRLMTVQAMFLDVYVGQHNTLLHIDRFRKLAPAVPLIVMSAGTSRDAIEDTLKAARKAGADYLLRKPFAAALVSDVLRSVASVEKGKRRTHVLVIDDSSTIRTFISRALDGCGYRVSQAETMEEAFGNINIAHVDVVLCDVFMPGMGGLKGMRTIKSVWPSVRVISMSAGIEGKVNELDVLNATRKIGVQAQLSKPFSTEELREVIEAVLEEAA